MGGEIYLISLYFHHPLEALAYNRHSLNDCFTFKSSSQWLHTTDFHLKLTKNHIPIRKAKTQTNKQNILTIPNAD